MRLLKRLFLLLVIALIAFGTYTVVSTGFFRTIEPHFDGEILKKVSINGAEDITISTKDSFALISATTRLPYPPDVQEEGGLYWMDLRTSDFQPVLLTGDFQKPFAPHGISIFPKDSGYLVMVINHTLASHSIEVFELYGKQLNHLKTLEDPSMIQPNDLVILDENHFYFTNDHGYTEGLGKLIEEYGGLGLSNVVYFDGKEYEEVADGIAYANGINFDRDRKLLFVASPRHFLVKVFDRNEDGTLNFIEDIPCGTGVDNIEFDEQGQLWVGCHPNLLEFASYAKGSKPKSPSEIIKIVYRGKGDYTVESIYEEDGSDMSASTVAAPFGKILLAGNVKDDVFLVMRQN